MVVKAAALVLVLVLVLVLAVPWIVCDGDGDDDNDVGDVDIKGDKDLPLRGGLCLPLSRQRLQRYHLVDEDGVFRMDCSSVAKRVKIAVLNGYIWMHGNRHACVYRLH